MINNDPASPGFNSYVSIAELTSYAEERSITLPDNPEPLLHEAMDYLSGLAYAGEPTDYDQPLSFPRVGIWCNGRELDGNSIPRAIKTAQIRLALAAMDVTLEPSYSGGPVVQSESIDGAVSVTYDTEGEAVSARANFPWLGGIIGCLQSGSGAFGNLQVYRG